MGEHRLKPRNAIFHSTFGPYQDLSLNLIDFTISEKELDTGRLNKNNDITITVLEKKKESDSVELF